MHRLTRQLILTLCALFLIGAQQAAFSHLIGHLGLTATASAQPAEAAGDAVALSLSHLCTSCLAISALAAGAPLPASMPAAPSAISGLPDGRVHAGLPVPTVPPYAARAPPYSL